ncbi:MAG: response regulator transcription factor [Burkholderiales bacterium]|nr:response regulator transcription factor [Burkholderiales bacterium]
MRLLIAEDDPLLADGLKRTLEANGFAVDHAPDGNSADHMASSQTYDLIILDLGLPGLDGFSVLKRLRRRAGGSSTTPVLVLTARTGLDDRVKGLNLGADDYLPKPFALPELEARVRALVRRGKFGASPQLQHGRLRFDTIGRRASVDDQPLELSAREVSMLETLLLSVGRVVSKEQLAEQLTGWGEVVGTNAIEVYIHRLRKKLETAGISVRTVRGLGYLLEKPGSGS